jgi:hypothetical protein
LGGEPVIIENKVKTLLTKNLVSIQKAQLKGVYMNNLKYMRWFAVLFLFIFNDMSG